MCGYPLVIGVQSIVRLLLALVLLVPGLAAAQPEDRPAPVDVDELPVSVNRVERELQRPQTLSFEVTQPLFRVEVTAQRPRWLTDIDWLGTENRIGPIVPHPTPHEQYLARVTPQLAQPYHAFEGTDLLQIAITSFLQSLATEKGTQALKDELQRRREEEARREVDESIRRWKDGVEQRRREETPQ